MPLTWNTLLLLALLLAAVITDLRSRRIPNTLVLMGTILALATHSLALGGTGAPLAGSTWWAPMAGFATGLVVLMPLYLMRALGAGDVKLLGMVGAFVGAPMVLEAAMYTLLAGGVLSLAVMFGTGVAGRTLTNLHFVLTEWTAWAMRLRSRHLPLLAPLQTTAARLPYALAISAGAVTALMRAHG